MPRTSDLKFTIPPDASDFGSWRNLPNTDIELERPPHVTKPAPNNAKKILNGLGLHLTSNVSFNSNGDSSDQPHVKTVSSLEISECKT